jgi:hypothetical protein
MEERKDLKGQLDQLERKDLPDPQVMMVLRDLKDLRGQLVLQGQPVLKEHKACKGLLVQAGG